MKSRYLIPAMIIALSISSPVFASEITGTLTAGSGSTVQGIVVGPPSATPAPGTYGVAQTISLAAPGASSIRYSTDGTVPNCAGAGLLFTGSISVVSSLTIQAISCYVSGASSTVGLYSYVISGGSLSGVVATSSGGSLSGTVAASPGGTLSGTVTAPSGASAGGGGSSSGGGGGGGGVSNPTYGVGGIAQAQGGVTIPGSVLGESIVAPNLPNTGAGGNASLTILLLVISALVGLLGVAYQRYTIR